MENENLREAIIMPREVLEQVVNYLGRKPFGEVAQIINNIQTNSQIIPENILLEKEIIKLKEQA